MDFSFYFPLLFFSSFSFWWWYNGEGGDEAFPKCVCFVFILHHFFCCRWKMKKINWFEVFFFFSFIIIISCCSSSSKYIKRTKGEKIFGSMFPIIIIFCVFVIHFSTSLYNIYKWTEILILWYILCVHVFLIGLPYSFLLHIV